MSCPKYLLSRFFPCLALLRRVQSGCRWLGLAGRFWELTFVEGWLSSTGLLCQPWRSPVSPHLFHPQDFLESSYSRRGTAVWSSLLFQYVKYHLGMQRVLRCRQSIVVEGEKKRRGRFRNFWGVEQSPGLTKLTVPGRSVLTFLGPAVQRRVLCFVLFCSQQNPLFCSWCGCWWAPSYPAGIHFYLWNKHVWVHLGLGWH